MIKRINQISRNQSSFFYSSLHIKIWLEKADIWQGRILLVPVIVSCVIRWNLYTVWMISTCQAKCFKEFRLYLQGNPNKLPSWFWLNGSNKSETAYQKIIQIVLSSFRMFYIHCWKGICVLRSYCMNWYELIWIYLTNFLIWIHLNWY